MNQQDVTRLKARARLEALMLRDEAHERADGKPGAATSHLLSALASFHGRVIAGYLPMRSEIDPLPAMTRMAEVGPVVVPVIVDRNTPLIFRAWTPGCTLTGGLFGTLIPENGAEMTPEAVIVPLVAFDRLHHRLGYGGGFYDRTLSQLRASGNRVRALGFAWAAQEMAALPYDSQDQKLDEIITEAGVLNLS